MKIALFITLLTCLASVIKAQNFSAWSRDQAHPNLQVRYAVNKDAFGYNTVILELTNSMLCSLDVTTSLCNTEGQGKNGWQHITIQPNKISRLSFKVKNNACVNGWWWWYRNYGASRPSNIFGG